MAFKARTPPTSFKLNASLKLLELRLVSAPSRKERRGLSAELDAAVEAMRRVPWTTLAELKGDREVLKKIDDAEELLKTLRKTLSR